MLLNSLPLLLAAALCAAMLGFLEAGRRLGARRRALARDGEDPLAGLGAVEGAIFALMGLLIAFTFSGAAARFDVRRAQIAEEANTIGTAWLRLDLLPAGTQPALRSLFRRYVDARLEIYRRMPDLAASQAAVPAATALQDDIWRAAVSASRDQPPTAAMLLLPALNQMIDITTTRAMAARTHPPPVIFFMLGALALTGALLAGIGMTAARTRPWLHMIAFAAIMAITVFVILDLEFPRIGLITLDSFDQVLVELRRSMGE